MGYSSYFIPSSSSSNIIPIILIITCSLLIPIPFSMEEDSELGHICLPNNKTFTSDYSQSRVLVLLDLIINTASSDGFRNISYAWPLQSRNERAYGLAACRGYVSPDNCKACVNNSAIPLINNCSYSREAIFWRDHCFLKYSNVDFFGKIDTANKFDWTSNSPWNHSNSADDVKKFMIHLNQTVILQTSNKFYAQNTTDIGGDYKLYGVAQCTRDISKRDCKDCLRAALTDLDYSHTGVIVDYGSCGIRYDTNNFLSD